MPDGSLVAGSGVSTNIIRAIRELERQLSAGPCDNPSLLEGDYTLLRLTPDGEAIVYYSELTPIYVDLPCAIGSGGEYAVGAMLAGASPERAVRIACQVDTASGGDIQVARPNRRKSK